MTAKKESLGQTDNIFGDANRLKRAFGLFPKNEEAWLAKKEKQEIPFRCD